MRGGKKAVRGTSKDIHVAPGITSRGRRGNYRGEFTRAVPWQDTRSGFLRVGPSSTKSVSGRREATDGTREGGDRATGRLSQRLLQLACPAIRVSLVANALDDTKAAILPFPCPFAIRTFVDFLPRYLPARHIGPMLALCRGCRRRRGPLSVAGRRPEPGVRGRGPCHRGGSRPVP